MHIKSILIVMLILLMTITIIAKEFQWKKDMTFLAFLRKNHIPEKIYYEMDSEDKELIQEIQAGQEYSIEKKNGEIVTINIPVSDELMLQIKKGKKKYTTQYVPIPYKVIEKTISIKIDKGLDEDLLKATKTSFYGKELHEVYSKALPLKKMKKGDRVIIFYTQKYRKNRAFTNPQIEACLIEIDKKPFYGFRMKDDKYYDSLGVKYQRTYKTSFIRPLPKFKRISSSFTHRRYHPILHRYRAHLGIDYAARSGRKIVASGKGKIVYRNWKGGYGRVIEIQHANGIKTLYAHMSKFAKGLKKGSTVEQGRVIGYVGTSGRSTGPHLHFGLYKNGHAVNPARYVKKPIATVVKLKGKEYKELRKKVLHYRPQFKEVKSNKNSIIKKESQKCLNCLKNTSSK